ncbi:MAG: hypothetical protein IT270_08050 [Saprospiraceae bacterium]|nr:hypothetical protein [Saprospiraceae bacterium]
MPDTSQVSTDSFTVHIQPTDEFGPTLFLTQVPPGAKRVYVECNLLTPTLGTSLNIDLTLDHNGERIYYRGQSFKAKAAGEWFRFQVMFLLPKHPEGATLKLYPWNRDKASWRIDYINVYVQE